MTTVINNTPKVRKYRYSEIFGNTFQGEGQYTGRPTVWVRFWGCNFNCNGFGQENPTDPSTWILDYENINVDDYKSMEELPVFHRGCDSSYSWSKKFGHLAHHETAAEICDKLEALLPGGGFRHPESGQWHHLAFTGGEPMMNQTAIVDIMREFDRRGNSPKYVTIETNGTQRARDEFVNYFAEHPYVGPLGAWKTQNEFGPRIYTAGGRNNWFHGELFWSISPKLYLSGEQWDEAIQPDIVEEYKTISDVGQLKYVCDNSPRAWDEVRNATLQYRDAGINWNVWIMPVGADREMQESHQAIVAEEAVKRGYSVAARVHTWVFGNVIGK